jgi:hypothetical protein
MKLPIYIHTTKQRGETIALVDCGATENFMSLPCAQKMGLPIKPLTRPQKLFNMDGTENKSGQLKHYTDLSLQTGSNRTYYRFYLSDLGKNTIILGYPWFTSAQPNIDWVRGWIDKSQLPIILQSSQCDPTP